MSRLTFQNVQIIGEGAPDHHTLTKCLIQRVQSTSAFDLAQGVDRAALGWDWYIYSWASNSDWTGRLWNNLAQGIPLREAATLDSEVGTEAGAVSIGFYTNVNPVIQGDSSMKLHGVYGGIVTSDGVGGLDIPWYRQL